jgi:L-rhamnose mutarotase
MKELSMTDLAPSTVARSEPAGTRRICFQLQVRPDRIADYVERHRAVWPEMLEAIRDAGRRNYSLYLRDDGLLIGYYETDDDAASAAALAADPRTAEWEATSTDLFVSLAGDRADQSALQLREVFNLEDQLASLGS